MENTGETTKPIAGSNATSSSSASRVSPLQGPCAACKVLRRRCVENCILAPYFPPTDPMRFINAHRVYGASNIVKFLQELPESKRADAINSMVYEANARIRDPVYGCAGAIDHLQKQLIDVQAELAMTQAEIFLMQSQQQPQQQPNNNGSLWDDRNLGLDFDPTHWE